MLAAKRGTEAEKMDQPSSRSCPKCGSGDYAFRSRKQIETTAEQEAMLETKYKCKVCGTEWTEKVPGVLRKGPILPK
jgi:rubredoxin